MKLAMFFLAVSLFFAFGAGALMMINHALWIVAIGAAVVFAIVGGSWMYFEGEASAASSVLE